jgi:glycosyltransferase involved in cell wall biosynthesis
MVKRISVAVNSWDCLDGLKLFVESYLDTTHDQLNTELCVALDGSSKESTHYISRMAADRNIKWCWAPHRGLSHSINQAFKLCTNEYILWASDDYVFMPEWDTLLRKYLHPDHFVGIYTFEPHNSPFPTREGLDYPALLSYLSHTKENLSNSKEELREELGYAFGNGAFSAQKMRAVEGFDVNFVNGSMDGDFIYRMHKAFPELIYFRPNDISFYHFTSSTRSMHPELNESNSHDSQTFFHNHGHDPGHLLYEKIKEHCSTKRPILESRGIEL